MIEDKNQSSQGTDRDAAGSLKPLAVSPASLRLFPRDDDEKLGVWNSFYQDDAVIPDQPRPLSSLDGRAADEVPYRGHLELPDESPFVDDLAIVERGDM